MRYTNLPPVGALTLPELETHWTAAYTPGRGRPIEDVFLHRWGITAVQSESIRGVIAEFLEPRNGASAHLVYAGERGPDAGRCVQMVRFTDTAWTEAADNREGLSIECGDRIWLGLDPRGFARAARITAYLCHRFKLPGQWVQHPHTSHAHGITRHGDGGAADGGHTLCPTTDRELWLQFVSRVNAEIRHGGFRPSWGR